jgi:DNA-binding Lrp family transcriptional regulator
MIRVGAARGKSSRNAVRGELMIRPRGNKTSKAAREQRRSAVVEVLKDSPNMTNKELADRAGVSLATLKRDLAELRERFSSVTDGHYEEFKKTQLTVFELIERNLVEGSIAPDVAREWRGIRSEISQLLGLNAPRRSESLNFNIDSDPQKLGPYQWFCHVTRGLSLEELRHPITDVCDRLRADKKPEPMPQPPKDSPLWHKERKELPQ